MSEIGQLKHIFKRQTDKEGSEITWFESLTRSFIEQMYLINLRYKCLGVWGWRKTNPSAFGRNTELFSRFP